MLYSKTSTRDPFFYPFFFGFSSKQYRNGQVLPQRSHHQHRRDSYGTLYPLFFLFCTSYNTTAIQHTHKQMQISLLDGQIPRLKRRRMKAAAAAKRKSMGIRFDDRFCRDVRTSCSKEEIPLFFFPLFFVLLKVNGIFGILVITTTWHQSLSQSCLSWNVLQGAHQRRSKTVEGDPLPLISPVPRLTMEQKKRGGIGGNQRVKHLSVAVEPVFGLLPFKLNV